MIARLRSLADAIGRAEAPKLRAKFSPLFDDDERVVEMATLLACAYPAMGPVLVARKGDVHAVAHGARSFARRDARAYRALAPAPDDPLLIGKLRAFAYREKIRIAARELFLEPAADVDVTARELSDLADVCIDVALRGAIAWGADRFGAPEENSIVVLGMGKLGGRELNAGSDVDLLFAYDNDDAHAREVSAHEFYTRVAQRMTATLDEATEDGTVWRVDLRLRPEGARGPLVNSHAAIERYYESWGRTWERAAFVRARAVAGDVELGARVIETLSPFVWRREVNPALAVEMTSLLHRARAEIGGDPERDLKHGRGGIREAEFFVQSLQLIWGGREREVRQRNTIDALHRLRARGLVTDRESREMSEAYLALRRVEHRVQFATGLQTHSLPEDPALFATIARSLGFSSVSEFKKDLERHRRRVAARFASLSPNASPGAPSLDKLDVALESRDEPSVLAALHEWVPAPPVDLARHVLALARRPGDPLGASSRDHLPELALPLIEALADAADPEQAACLLAAFFARLMTPSVYSRALARDVRALRRLVGLFGASQFLGNSLVAHPELADAILFGRSAPTAESAARAVAEEIAACDASDVESFVGALRRAKRRVTMEVGVNDLSGEIDFREVARILSALADASIDAAVEFASRERCADENKLAVIALGKLGGREIGYGSDLDLVFVHEENDGAKTETAIRVAQRALRLLDAPHGDGAGYELDTRLRPSGSQGLLVVSLEAFARYHERVAEPWERQALIKARACAGDRDLGRRVIAVAETAAYELGAPPPDRLHQLRMRMQRELSGERIEKGRYDAKLGSGGIADIEFATQWLQMKFGKDERVRARETEDAIARLEMTGALEPQLATIFREGYVMLRRLEQRARVHHGSGGGLIERDAPGVMILARRLGMRDSARSSASAALLDHYVAVTREVRRAYLSVLGVSAQPEDLTSL